MLRQAQSVTTIRLRATTQQPNQRVTLASDDISVFVNEMEEDRSELNAFNEEMLRDLHADSN